MRKIIFSILTGLLFVAFADAQAAATQGGLEIVGANGQTVGACPLKSTNVQAEISGFLSRVKVTQEFENNSNEKIEAVYVFPLPNDAAVDDLTMRIGTRTIRGKIMKREEAREVYEAAKSNGQIASLLDQERPNIFTQSVANILPNEKIIIEISYVETLKYDDGAYQFTFPMVVGPRYIPGDAAGKQAGGFAPDTTQVPDASKITPTPALTRAGHDISISVNLDAGVLIENVQSKSHEIEAARTSAHGYAVKLKNEKTIPNKDFILRYDVSGKKIEDAVLTHRGERGGYFTLILQPPGEVRAQDVTPKEIVFVLDTSGSMSGFPIEKAKEAMKLALDGLHPQDTFNLITFAGDTSVLFKEPVAATRENLAKAQAFLESRQGGGGTEMMKAIKAALDASDSQQHVRVVCFMTDGYIGNDLEIVGEIQKHPNARVFSFGIGQSVNRFLLDKMAEEGRGEAEYVALNDDGSLAAKRFHERVRSPLLTDISLDFGDLLVADVYPKRINDLFSAKPVVVHGRYTKGGSGTIKLKGKSFGRETVREININFPENEARHDVLATLWARTRIDDLMRQDYQGIQNGNAKPEIKDTITNLGIEYRLLTQFTSFVAVEERIVTDGGQPRKIEVLVEMPEGVSREGVFAIDGSDTKISTNISQRNIQTLPVNGRQFSSLMKIAPGAASGSGSGAGNGNGSGSGNINANAGQASQIEVQATVEVSAETVDISSDSPAKRMKPKTSAIYREWNKNDVVYIISGANKAESAIVIKLSDAPKPIYPSNIKGAGAVKVEIALDANGKVTFAKASDGDARFYQSAETAARETVFELPKLEAEIVKITGVIVYDFAKNKKVTVAENLHEVRIETRPNKYHSAIKSLVERLKNNQTKPAADESKFVKDGAAEIVVRVGELKPETVAALKNLGFEVLTEMTAAKAIVGRIAVEKIAAIAELEAVTFISPQNR